MRFHEIRNRLDVLLRVAGCRQYGAREALADAAECWREVEADRVAHGQVHPQPFCNWIVAENVGVFAFYDTVVEFYVVPGSEAEFRRVFEPLAMVDVAEARKLLQSNFARSQPDLAMPPTLSTAWLASTGV